MLALAIGYAVFLLVVFLVAYALGVYNVLIMAQQTVKREEANVRVSLKKRADLISQMLKVVREYAAHEKEVFQRLAELKSSLLSESLEEAGRAEAEVRGLLQRLFGFAEAYPELKASENYLKLQEALTSIENELAARREAYNEAVRAYNTLLEAFPTSLVASWMKLKKAEYFGEAR